jgi:putative redox protein
VRVQASQPDTHPHVFTQARITYMVTGRAVDEAALLRAIGLSAQKYCPAQAMLSKAFPMELVYEIYETDGSLVKKGQWLP